MSFASAHSSCRGSQSPTGPSSQLIFAFDYLQRFHANGGSQWITSEGRSVFTWFDHQHHIIVGEHERYRHNVPPERALPRMSRCGRGRTSAGNLRQHFTCACNARLDLVHHQQHVVFPAQRFRCFQDNLLPEHKHRLRPG